MKGNKIYNVSYLSPRQKLEEFSLQCLMKYILIIGQCFALLPVDGLTTETEKLKFRWFSFKTIYSAVAVCVQIFFSVIILIYSVANLENFFSFVAVVWNVRSLMGIIIFLRLARKWPMLLKEWRKMEYDMLTYGPLPTLKLRFKILPLFFLIFGLAEHVMYVYETLKNIISGMTENDNVLEKYCFTLNPGFYEYFRYRHWNIILLEFSRSTDTIVLEESSKTVDRGSSKLGAKSFIELGLSILVNRMLQFSSLLSTFMWQYCNLFIVLFSSALAERFRQINNVVNKTKVLTETQWKEIRKQYNTLSLLCKTLNNSIAEVVLLSFFGNVYFLSIAVFQSLKPRTTIQEIFFWYSIIFYIAHVVTVCLYGAWVYEESWSAISKISSLPVKNISHDVNRILNQMAARDIAITGAGLFNVTRNIILKVGGVIVTLQLIFTEFNAKF